MTVTWIAPRDPVTPSRSSVQFEADGKVRPARNDGSPPPGARDSCAGGDVIDVDGTVSDVFIVGAAVGFGVTIGATGAAVGIRVIVGTCEWCQWCLCVGGGTGQAGFGAGVGTPVDTPQEAAAGAIVNQEYIAGCIVAFFTPVSKASTFESRTVTSSKSAGSVGSLSSSRNARSESFSLACRTLGAHVGVRAALLLGLRGQALRWCFAIRLALLIREERPCRGALHLFECLRFAAELLWRSR